MGGVRSQCQNGDLQEISCRLIFLGISTTSVLALSEPQLTHASPAYPPRPTGRSSPSSYGVTVLCWVPVHIKSCVHPPKVESLFLPVLWSSCTQAPVAFKAKCFGGSSYYGQTLRLGSLTWGSELTPVGEPLQYNYFPVCGLPSWRVWNLSYIMKVPLLPSCCGFFFVFGCEVSFLVGSSPFCQWLLSCQL